MPIRSTLLSTIIARMDRYQSVIQNSNEVYKVRDIDEGIRRLRRKLPLPWALQKGSLRVFDGVESYPVATDHDELAYLDTSENVLYPAKARFRYTSLQQFYEDSSNRNQIAEIWYGGQRKLGVNYKDIKEGTQILNEAETVGDWTASGDASTPVLDEVTFKDGNGSIRFTITLAASSATMRNTLPVTLNDSEYKKKYHFKWIYLDAAPTSIQLRLETTAAKYVYTNVTTQFDGSPFSADQWNLIAQDLNTATDSGTFDSSSITAESVVLTGAASGTYYIDASYLRAWTLLDYWYYSIYSVIASGGSVATKEYFYDDTATPAYNTDDLLVGDSEWIDVIMYRAILINLIDIKDKDTKEEIRASLNEALGDLIEKYPEMSPVIIQDRYNFIEDFVNPA